MPPINKYTVAEVKAMGYFPYAVYGGWVYSFKFAPGDIMVHDIDTL